MKLSEFKLIQHDRKVTAEQIQRYGELATHDIEVPILLIYELGKIKDKNGTEVVIDKEFINNTLQATNDWIKKRHSSIFASFKKAWNRPIDEVLGIPIIKNHDVEDVDGVGGYIKGLLYTNTIDDKYSLLGTVVLIDPKVKLKVQDGLLRNTSIGTRGDGSIKEVSFVINEAAPHGGLLMSEPTTKTVETKSHTSQELSLAEEIAELQFAEQELTNTIIPNHMIIARMIKQGKIQPWKREELIKEDTRVLKLMESSSVGVDIGLMFGTAREPQKMDITDPLIDNIVSNYKKETGKQLSEKSKKADKKTIEPKTQINAIHHGISLEEARKKELHHLKELATHSPDILLKYLNIELGEPQSIEEIANGDKLLAEYLNEATRLKQKIIELKTIQLGE